MATNMQKPTKRYILWIYSDGGYQPTEYDTLEEALLAEKFSSAWYLTETINHITASSYYRKPEEKTV